MTHILLDKIFTELPSKGNFNMETRYKEKLKTLRFLLKIKIKNYFLSRPVQKNYQPSFHLNFCLNLFVFAGPEMLN